MSNEPIITGEVIEAASKASEKDIRRPKYKKLKTMSKEKRHDRMKFIDENASIATTEELIAARYYLMGYEYADELNKKAYEAGQNCAGDYTYAPYEEWKENELKKQ